MTKEIDKELMREIKTLIRAGNQEQIESIINENNLSVSQVTFTAFAINLNFSFSALS